MFPISFLPTLNMAHLIYFFFLLTEQPAQSAKKAKLEAESGGESANSVPIVIISEALANFFGTAEKEMSQAEVLRQVWEYIKVNQLEVGYYLFSFFCFYKL